MPPLRATYRLQFHRGFGLDDAHRLIDYLHRLGISHVYASPLLQARRGSKHGYDVTDPTRLNADIGTPEQFATLARGLRTRGMGILLDVVPNHMAASSDNPWWRDVLARGQHSRYARWFDVDWSASANRRVLLPVVGGSVAGAIAHHEFRLELAHGAWVLRYHDHEFPLALHSYPEVMALARTELETLANSDATAAKVVRMAEAIGEQGMQADASGPLARGMHMALRHAGEESPGFRRWWRLCRMRWHRNPARLAWLLGQQHYRSENWRAANREINYRRFFAINDLVSFRVELEDAFAAQTGLVAEWLRRRWVEALRVDHIDGLDDPLTYLRRLQALFPGGTGPVVVEKILAPGEQLPREWPVLGATGYEFLYSLDRLQTPPAAAAMLELYRRFIRRPVEFPDVVYGKKRQIIRGLFRGEIAGLGRRLHGLAREAGRTDMPAETASRILTCLAACFPVYRTYARTLRMSAAERRAVTAAGECAAWRNPALPAATLQWASWVLSCDPRAGLPARAHPEWLALVRRWQQYTPPIMAKGQEDSAFYVYVPLPALCEVGSDPARISAGAQEFHRAMGLRQRRHPGALNATSTHDSKRSEDVRARLNALTEIAGEFRLRLGRWGRWNAGYRGMIRRRPAPSRELEYLYYQTLLGAWPLEPGPLPAGFRRRIRDYMLKAAREAKVETFWERPNLPYESALTEFIAATLDEHRSPRFLADLRAFAARLAPAGALNSLVQLGLKILLPGVPDCYQGCELWNYALVDPDNRQPVDFELRQRMLSELLREERAAADHDRFLHHLLQGWSDGRVKLWLTRQLLRLRTLHEAVFAAGSYLPVSVTGRRSRHLLAFLRRSGPVKILIVVPLAVAAATLGATPAVSGFDWSDTRLHMVGPLGNWRDVLRETRVYPQRGGFTAAELFRHFPVAVLQAEG